MIIEEMWYRTRQVNLKKGMWKAYDQDKTQ